MLLTIKSISIYLVLMIAFSIIMKAQSYDLFLQDTTISTTTSFEAINSITTGPNFIIDNTADVTFRTGVSVTINPFSTIYKEGKFQIFTDENIGIEENSNPTISFFVKQNTPNPFTNLTLIEYNLPVTDYVQITIYDLSGKQIKMLLSKIQIAGKHSIEWDGTNESGEKVSKGIFIYKVETKKYQSYRNMIVL